MSIIPPVKFYCTNVQYDLDNCKREPIFICVQSKLYIEKKVRRGWHTMTTTKRIAKGEEVTMG
jgi:hypothetical protein